MTHCLCGHSVKKLSKDSVHGFDLGCLPGVGATKDQPGFCVAALGAVKSMHDTEALP